MCVTHFNIVKEQFLKKNEFILQKRYKDLEENFANDVLEESNKKP